MRQTKGSHEADERLPASAMSFTATDSGVVVISLGWGVQSFTLAAMAALGELPEVDFCLHSDTSWEHSYTYAFREMWEPWLEECGLRVITVHDVGVAADIFSGAGVVDVPLHTLLRYEGRPEGWPGKLQRHCTHKWKIRPQRRYLRAAGYTRVTMYLGISTDEWHRAKDADVGWLTNAFPLLERGMSRSDCVSWLAAHDLPVPGRSACVFCPLRKASEWVDLARGGGVDWGWACAVDAQVRARKVGYECYVHRSCKPLAEALAEHVDVGRERLAALDAECDSGYCFL